MVGEGLSSTRRIDGLWLRTRPNGCHLCLSFHVYVQLVDPQLANHVGMARLGWHHVNMSERQQLR